MFLVGIAVIIQNRYDASKKEAEANSLIQLSRSQIELGNLEHALNLLDSLKVKYSTISGVAYMTEKMNIEIQKIQYNDSIARIIKEIDKSKHTDKVLIDSLEKQKAKLKWKYTELEIAENKYQCKQCAIYLQNAKK